MAKKVVFLFLALASFISVDAQNEVLGGYVKKDGTESGINATSRFPMYSVMKFPQALYVADILTRNNIELNTEVMVRKDKLMQDTWSPMLETDGGMSDWWRSSACRSPTISQSRSQDRHRISIAIRSAIRHLRCGNYHIG